MDFYRFFLPQHNPRLLSIAPRQIELAELEQIAGELLKAVSRLKTRNERARKDVTASEGCQTENLESAIAGLNIVVSAMAKCCDEAPEDTDEQLLDIVRERSSYPGWERWTALVLEQFASSPAFAGMRQTRLDASEVPSEVGKKAA